MVLGQVSRKNNNKRFNIHHVFLGSVGFGKLVSRFLEFVKCQVQVLEAQRLPPINVMLGRDNRETLCGGPYDLTKYAFLGSVRFEEISETLSMWRKYRNVFRSQMASAQQ